MINAVGPLSNLAIGVRVAEEDMKHVIGREVGTAHAIRKVVSTMARKHGCTNVMVSLLDADEADRIGEWSHPSKP